MLKPKLLGSLVLVYVLLGKSWEVLGLLGLLISGDRVNLHDSGGLFVLVTSALAALLAVSYVIGGVGLILSRIWAAVVVFLTATLELAVAALSTVAGIFMMVGEPNVQIGGLLVFGLMSMFFPSAIAYAALRLHRNIAAWQPSQRLTGQESEAEHLAQIELPPRAWLRWLFRAIIGTGLVLPPIMALIVRNLLLAQGKPVVDLNEGVPWVIFGTIFYAAPFIALAFMGRSALKRTLRDGNPSLGKKCFIFVGAFVGMTIFITWDLSGFFQSTESIEMLIFVPFFPFFSALPGVALGALAGWGVYGLRQLMTDRNA